MSTQNNYRLLSDTKKHAQSCKFVNFSDAQNFALHVKFSTQIRADSCGKIRHYR